VDAESVDEALWPIRRDDVLFDDRGTEWLAVEADAPAQRT
jgi:hypothetical protein